MSSLSPDALDGASTVTAAGRGSGTASGRGLPPVVILLLGMLIAGACLPLLFGSFYAPNPPPGEMVRYLLLGLLDGRGPFFVQDLLWNRFVLIVAVLLVLVLAVLPWWAVRSQRRGGRSGGHRIDVSFGAAGSTSPGTGGTRVTRTEHRSSLTFSDDGRILDEECPGALTIERSVPELRSMARATRIPWNTVFETEGGARGFLEILRALSTGPVRVRTEAGSIAAEQDLDTDPARPAGQPDPGDDPEPPGEPAERAPLEAGGSDGYRYSTASWSSIYSGSDYTSINRYAADRSAGPGEDEEQDR
ncbi:MAG: hypothetical protein L0H74_14245 [Brachybacterium sp.]|nr:hypothetical protein [Brachybacterium sp.]